MSKQAGDGSKYYQAENMDGEKYQLIKKVLNPMGNIIVTPRNRRGD